MEPPEDERDPTDGVEGGRMVFSDQSATGQARQHVGNNYNNQKYYYSLRRQRSDETLRKDERSRVLLRAAAEGQTPRVKHLLGLKVDFDFTDDESFTALHHAVLSGYEDVVDLLLRAGADVNARSLDWGSPLCLAALKGRGNVAKQLLEYRADVQIPSKLVGTPLHCTVYAPGLPEIARTLIDFGANLEAISGVTGSLVRELLQSNTFSMPDLSTRLVDKSGKPYWIVECQPLILAVWRGRRDLVDVFVEAGCCIDIYYRQCEISDLADTFDDVEDFAKITHCTLLMAACGGGQSDIARTLLRSGASITALDSRGCSALHYAARRGSLSCTKLLLEAGAALDLASKGGKTPVVMAYEKGHHRVADYLIEQGVNSSYSLSRYAVRLHIPPWK